MSVTSLDTLMSSNTMNGLVEELQVWNQDPKPFVWTATVESILAKLSGCRQTLEQIQPGCTVPPQRRKRKLSS